MYKEVLKKLIIHCADIYVEENSLSEKEIRILDGFADLLLDKLDVINTLRNER